MESAEQAQDEARARRDTANRILTNLKADRTRAHLFVSVVAYHLLACIERTLCLKGDTRCWSTLREERSTHQRSTVSLRGGLDTIHQIRVSGTPEDAHEESYRLLEVPDPLPRMRRDLNVRL